MKGVSFHFERNDVSYEIDNCNSKKYRNEAGNLQQSIKERLSKGRKERTTITKLKKKNDKISSLNMISSPSSSSAHQQTVPSVTDLIQL